ncbi:FRIGIDA-like protein 3 [Linum perenne]
MEGDIGNGVGVRGSMMQPHLLRETIAGFRDRVSSFAVEFDSTADAIEARSRKLRLEEEKVEDARKELEKAQEVARRKSNEFEAREEAFEFLMKKEISERKKLEELVEELRKEIELEKAEKESVEVKLKELGESGEEMESLGGYLEMKAIQIRESEEELENKQRKSKEELEKKRRESEEELEKKRRESEEELEKKRRESEEELEKKRRESEEELEKKLREVDRRFEKYQLKEKKFKEQLAEFRQKQAEFEVCEIQLNVKEREFGEKDLEVGFEERVNELNRKGLKLDMGLAELKKNEKEIDAREAKFEEELAEFRLKQAEFEVRVVELNAKEREIDEKVKQCRESEMNTRVCSYEFMEKKLEEQFNMLSKRIDELELKRVKDLESIEKQFEITSRETVLKAKKPAKSLDHSSEANIRHCVITSGKDVEMTEKSIEMTGEAVMKAKELSESLNPSSEGNIRLCVLTSGKDLQIFLNEHSDDYDLVKDEVERALKLSSDPAKLVLDAMVGFYPPRLKKGGVEFEETVVRKNCLWLLEWLTKISPHIKPKVKDEAKELAYAWKRKMKSDAEHSLSVLAFLQLLAAFELANYFQHKLAKLLPIISHYSQAPLVLRDLGFGEEMTSVLREKLLKKKQRDKAEALISAFELDSEFPSLILRKINPKESQMLSGKCSGTKRSWSDACGENNHAEYLDMSYVTAQPTEDSNLPERSSNDQADCSNPISLNSDSEAEKENDSEDSEEENDFDSAEENKSEDFVEENEDNSLPRISSFEPQCLGFSFICPETVVWRIKNNTLCCIEVSDALKLASDPAGFVLGVVKNPSSLNLKAGLRSVCLKSPEHGPLLLLNYLWRMSPHIEPNVRREALSFAKDWRHKLAEKFKDYSSDYLKGKEYIDGICFLLILAAYKLECYFEEDELFSVFGTRCWCLYAVKLFLKDLNEELAVWKDVVNHNLADERCKAYISYLEKQKQKIELEQART